MINNKYGFRGFDGVECDVQLEEQIIHSLTDDTTKSENVLLNHLFAPDPITGNPSSMLPLMADEDSDIGRYIRDHFARGVPSSRGTDDADLALQIVSHDEYESSAKYVERIRNYMKDKYLTKSKKDE